MGIPDPSSKAYKQRRGTYFYYNRAAIGLACAQATAMRIDIAPHKRPRRKQTRHAPDPPTFTSLHTYASITSNIRLIVYRKYYSWGNSQCPPFILSS